MYETRCAAQGSDAAMHDITGVRFLTELFFSAQNKGGLSFRRLCPAEDPWRAFLLAACKTLAKAAQSGRPKSSTAAVCVWAQG